MSLLIAAIFNLITMAADLRILRNYKNIFILPTYSSNECVITLNSNLCIWWSNRLKPVVESTMAVSESTEGCGRID